LVQSVGDIRPIGIDVTAIGKDVMGVFAAADLAGRVISELIGDRAISKRVGEPVGLPLQAQGRVIA
jgi:hypothetical protein